MCANLGTAKLIKLIYFQAALGSQYWVQYIQLRISQYINTTYWIEFRRTVRTSYTHGIELANASFSYARYIRIT